MALTCTYILGFGDGFKGGICIKSQLLFPPDECRCQQGTLEAELGWWRLEDPLPPFTDGQLRPGRALKGRGWGWASGQH